MIDPAWFLSELTRHRVGCVTGVPCSYVSGLYTLLEGEQRYVSATNEAESVAIAAGVWLGGSQAVALCQNSGLGNMTNPLSSLAVPYRIPVLLGVSRRGWPAGADEPQHALMGRITPELLGLLEVATETLDPAPEVAAQQIEVAVQRCADRRSAALVIEKGLFDNVVPTPAVPPVGVRPPAAAHTLSGGARPRRADVIAAHLALEPARVTVATTGYTGRELYGMDDRDSHFYMAGSMGCAAGIGVGLATTGHPVTVLDGDGALLMRLGSLATVGRYVRSPYLHVVLDNGRHESTGGQHTNGAAVDFAAVAVACGYRAAWRCDGIDAVREALRRAVQVTDGPVLVHCRVEAGTSGALPRPRQRLDDLAARLRAHLSRKHVPASVPL
ncbi:phosphonopyruvate decarboxylase [Micromonospora sp. WMMD882]|uniref:phosphonopyruvate decarboxylase n=1 Tax=Micromonospora sp. WMMD882 TaxID=3015151 RepID=UPI00248AA0AF|nr:phosphonopyruvate decarboxylase [Micromonospora sp. WMMD882]WBB78445.1 phosphonopyruvate decarboxylase [Micromonospora sp. WMMD882]